MVKWLSLHFLRRTIMKNEIIRAQQDLFRISTLLQSLWKQLDEFQNCACSPTFDAYLNGVDVILAGRSVPPHCAEAVW